MTPDTLNATSSQAALLKPAGSAPRIVAPDWNGQAGQAKSVAAMTKTLTFTVLVSDGSVTVKKAHVER